MWLLGTKPGSSGRTAIALSEMYVQIFHFAFGIEIFSLLLLFYIFELTLDAYEMHLRDGSFLCFILHFFN